MTPLKVMPGIRESTERPIDLLLACHERMRRFAALAVRVATITDAPANQLAEAAHSIHRYFNVALPLHVQDEDLTLRPILLDTANAAVRRALDQMSEEHVDIDAALLALLPRWQLLAQHPEKVADEIPTLLAPSTALQLFLSEHLALEELLIFPFLDSLGAEFQSRILKEMRARRAAPKPV